MPEKDSMSFADQFDTLKIPLFGKKPTRQSLSLQRY
jgi:hypothetical protein